MKRHRALHSLSHEHQHGLALALKLKCRKEATSSAVEEDVSEMQDELTCRFERELCPHFEREEKFLAPLFKQNVLMNRMLDEHARLESLYFKIVDNPEGLSDEQLREKLNLFGELLDLHIRFEERELFPMIEEKLTDVELKYLSEKLEGE